MIIALKYRIKDKTSRKRLEANARAANFVWNYCCQIQREAEDRWKAGRVARWPTAFDLDKLCAGVAADIGVHSDTVFCVCRQFVISRDAKRRCPKFRVSNGPRRALGWVPFKGRTIKVDADAVVYLKRKFRFWKSRDIEGELRAGAFAQDARGRWYISLQCKVGEDRATGIGSIGIDLGLKALATCSNGDAIPALRHYREYETALGKAQRAKNKRRVRAIHAKIANARKHHLHEQSTRIVRENRLIVVGDVNAAKLAKTKMAKSVLDASWSMFRAQLAYKARRHNAVFIEVNERFTSQTCSCCGAIPDSSPKGMGALGIRHWVCSDCGVLHDRDVNAARNILRVGLERQAPAGEVLAA